VLATAGGVVFALFEGVRRSLVFVQFIVRPTELKGVIEEEKMLSRLFSLLRKDPISEWPEVKPTPLVYSYAFKSLNGVAIEDPFTSIRKFGRPQNKRPLEKKDFLYPNLGLIIELEEDKVDGFVFIMNPEQTQHKKMTASKLRMAIKGSEVELTSNISTQEVMELLGSATEEFKDDRFIEFSYHLEGVRYFFIFGVEGKLEELRIHKIWM
jgi:hypothetical protein